MKIAIVTNDGQNISQHFGRSRFYKILSIDDRLIINEEMRERGTGHFAKNKVHEEKHEHINAEQKHGYGQDADSKHASMAAEISDCQVLIAGGMGQGAYESFKRSGLNVFLTDIEKIEDAVNEFINGNLQNLYQSRTD
jgi:predicted Fe-Mo cluster-binding NifX family protein